MTDERSWLIRHLHTHPVHATRYPAGHDFVLVSTARIRDQHEHLHKLHGSKAETMTDDSTVTGRNAPGACTPPAPPKRKLTDEPGTVRNQPEDLENPVSDIHTRIFNGRPPADDDEEYPEDAYFDRFSYRGNTAPGTVRALDTLTGDIVDIRITIVRKGGRT